MSYNIGPRIGIEGESKFRNSIKQINDTYKALEAETKAVTAAFDVQGDELGKLEATSKLLEQQISQQLDKFDLLKDAVAKASDKFGENSIEATRLRGALYDTQATLVKLRGELSSVDERLVLLHAGAAEFEAASESLRRELDASQESIKLIDASYKTLEAETRAVTAAFDAQGDEQGKLEATSTLLQQQIEQQEKKFDLLKDVVAKTSDEFGENSIEAIRLRGALYDTQTTLTKLKSELSSVDDRLGQFSQGLLDVENGTETAESALEKYQSSIRLIDASYKTLEAETKAVTAAFDAQGDEQGKLEAVSQQLVKQISEQQKKMALLEDAVAKTSDEFGENSIEANQLRTELFNTQTTLTKLRSEFQDTKSKLNQTSEAMEDVEEATEDAGAAAIDFGDVLKANLVSDLIMDGLREMAELVKDFASGSIEAAADVQAATAQFEQTFKGIESAASDALDNISDDTNIASTRMQGSFTTLYAFAKNAGAGASEALNLSSRAMVAAADNAAYYDKSIEEATEQLQSFLKGNYENDAALGISATETTRNTKANELYAKSFNKLSESQKVDVLLAMVEAGNKASGAIGQAARESDSWENVTGELAEVMRLLQAEAGKPALKKLVPIIKDITEAGYELIDDIDWEKFGETVENIADGVIDHGPGVVKAIAAVAAGIAAFKATQRIKEFASLAQSFIGIGTAAKTAGTAVAASGAMAAATPWGLVATVIGGVVSAISLIAMNSQKVQSDLEKATAKLAETIEEANATYESSKGEIEGAAYAAEYYVARLRELEEAGLDTAVAHREYEQVVEQLNELIPDLNLEIDEQTGLINTDTDALKANIQVWKNNAVAKALQDKYTDVLEAQGEAAAELLDAEARLNTLLDQRADLEQAVKTKAAERERVSKRLTDVQEKLASAEHLTAEESERLYKEWADLEEQYSSMSYDLALLSHDLQDTADKQSILTEDIEKAEAAVDSYEGEIAQLEAATELYAEKTADATRETELLTEAELQLQKNLESLEQEYAEAAASAMESLNSQIGLFEELTMKSDWSAEKILKNWESQRQAFESFAENLQSAVDLGLDEELIQQVSNFSVENAQILDAMVNDTEISVAEINEAFAKLSEGKEHMISAIAEVETDYKKRFDALTLAAEQAGKDISSGLARGVSQNSSTFVNAMGSVAQKGLNEFRYTYDSHSPSRVMIAEGKNIDTGAALGVDKNVELFERSMTSLAELGYDAFLEKRIDRAMRYPEMVSEYSTVNNRSVAHNYGDMSFVINQQPGESAEDLAYRIMDIIHAEVASKEASLGG